MPSSGGQTCARSEEHTSELQSHDNLVCRLLLEKRGKDCWAPTAPVRAHSSGAHRAIGPHPRRGLPHPRPAPPPHRHPARRRRLLCFFLTAGPPPELPRFPPPAALRF